MKFTDIAIKRLKPAENTVSIAGFAPCVYLPESRHVVTEFLWRILLVGAPDKNVRRPLQLTEIGLCSS